MTGESKTASRYAVALERERDALELRKGGATYAEIADRLGITESGAYRAVRRALSKLAELSLEEATELRTLELERLDRLLLAVWPTAIQGHLGAIDRAERLIGRRARILGIEGPIKLEGEFDFRELVRAAAEDDDGDP